MVGGCKSWCVWVKLWTRWPFYQKSLWFLELYLSLYRRPFELLPNSSIKLLTFYFPFQTHFASPAPVFCLFILLLLCTFAVLLGKYIVLDANDQFGDLLQYKWKTISCVLCICILLRLWLKIGNGENGLLKWWQNSHTMKETRNISSRDLCLWIWIMYTRFMIESLSEKEIS